jgi:hypothetical protein
MAVEFVFQQATREQAKARIALTGPSGAGKTFTALAIASGLGDRIAVIDTEHGSASKYAHKFPFATVCLDSFDPRLYVKAIEAAEAAGFDVIVIDSLSHAWEGKDGALEQIDHFKGSVGGNSWAAWSKVTPMHRDLIEAIVGSSSHVIATMRTKTAWEAAEGKKTPQKVGLAPIQRDGMEYEFDVVGAIDLDHNMEIQKTRYEELDGQRIYLPGPDLGRMIRSLLSAGAPPIQQFQPAQPLAPAPIAQPAPQPATQATPVAPAPPTAPAQAPEENCADETQRAQFARLLDRLAELGKSRTLSEQGACQRVTDGRQTQLIGLSHEQAAAAIDLLKQMVKRFESEADARATDHAPAPQMASTPDPVPAPTRTVDPETGEIIYDNTTAPQPELVGAGGNEELNF